MQQSQVLVYKDKKKVLRQDLHDSKTEELIILAYVVLLGDKHSIAMHVEKALDVGATRKDILNVISCIVGDARLLSSILELFRALRFEECSRREYISVVDKAFAGSPIVHIPCIYTTIKTQCILACQEKSF